MAKWQFKHHLIHLPKKSPDIDGLVETLRSGRMSELDQFGIEGWEIVDVAQITQGGYIMGLLYTLKREIIDDN